MPLGLIAENCAGRIHPKCAKLILNIGIIPLDQSAFFLEVEMASQKNLPEVVETLNKVRRLYLQIEDKRLPVVVVSEEHVTALVSGNSLRQTGVTVYLASPKSHQQLLAFLERAGKTGITSLDEEGRATRWKVRENDWRIEDQGYGETYLHKIYLDEIDPILPRSLVINGLEYHPYYYQEEIDPEVNGLVIKARIFTDEVGVAHLISVAQAARPAAVIRADAQDGIRLMILGAGFWSQHPDGIKQEISLVEWAAKEKDLLGLAPLNTLYENAARLLSEMLAQQEQRLDELKTRGMVSEAALAEIRQPLQEQAPMLRRRLLQVVDIDAPNPSFEKPEA